MTRNVISAAVLAGLLFALMAAADAGYAFARTMMEVTSHPVSNSNTEKEASKLRETTHRAPRKSAQLYG